MESEIKYIYGLTPLQEGMLFHKLVSEESSSYHNQDSVWIDEEIQLEKFKLALKLLMVKHEAIGAAFVVPNTTGIPRQVFFQEREIECSYEVTDRNDVDQCIDEIRNKDLDRGFDLQNDCLMRVHIVQFTENGKYYILASHHHIIMDGWCMSIVFSDLMRYYKQMTNGDSYEKVYEIVQKEKETSSKYIEYLKWLKKVDRKNGLEYWKNLLDGYENIADISPLVKVSDSMEGVKEKTGLFEQNEYGIIKEVARKFNVTVNTVFEVAWGILLQKYSYLDDVVFGKVVSGRNVPIRGIEETVGLFINTIPCRVSSTADKVISDLFKEVQNQAAMSTSYDFCPLFEIQKQTRQRADLIKSLINFEYGNNYQEMALEQSFSREETNYDINLSFYLENNQVLLRLIYNSGKYTENEMDRLLFYYRNLVHAMVTNPQSTIENLSLLDKNEEKRILQAFNDTSVAYPKEKTVVEIFENQVEKNSEKKAVVFGDETITYGELNRRSNSLAKKLRECGVKPDDFVAIIADRSIEMICGIYGIIKAGGAYVPIDPAYPEDRISFMLEDCEPKAVLKYTTEKIDIAGEIPVIDLKAEEVWEGENENLEHVNKPNDLIYCIYTSGTTGKPKGVVVENHSVVNLVKNCNFTTLNEETVILQTGQLMFDASTFEIWGTGLNGGTLHLIDKDVMLNVKNFKTYLNDNGVNTLFITTALFNQFVSEDKTIFNCLSHLMFGGEVTSEKHVELIREQNTNIDFRNVYGPTETTTFATHYVIESKVDKTPIGKPISNTRIYICNGENLCGIGVPGELCIAGGGLARGYLNRSELTKEKFVKNPFEEGKMYRSGDLARWLPDGNIEFLGRIDEQVKIRGFRIELGEIESRIREIEGIKDCAVIAKADRAGDRAIHAYYTSKVKLNEAEIREKLKENLPEYMIPSNIMEIDIIPVTRNGKIDKRALPDIDTATARKYIAPRNEVEEMVCNAFSEILNIEKVGITDSFFELGGDSIKAIRVVSKLRMASYDISVRDIMKYHIVENIAKVVTSSCDNQYFQGEVVGDVIETPIIREFFSKNMKKPSHYNQSIMLSVPTEDDTVVCRVLDAITKHHDMLRAIYHEEKLIIRAFEEQKGYDFSSANLKDDLGYSNRMEEECNRIQESISLEIGPLMKTALFKTVEGAYLFICIHHLVIDAVSWRVLAEDISTSFGQILNGQKVVLPAKTASYKEWSETLKSYEESETLMDEIPYWNNIIGKEWPASYEKEAPVGKTKRIEYIQKNFGIPSTSLLLIDANKPYYTETKDLLVAALVLALGKVSNRDNVVIGLEGHGREELHKKVQVDRTVGWFTSLYPMIFEYSDHMEDVIISVKDDLRNVPNNGLGYGLLGKKLGEKEIPVAFNYLGELDTEKYENGGIANYSTGVNVATENVFFKLAMDASITEKDLVVELAYDVSEYRENTAREILSYYMESLQEIVSFCATKNQVRRTSTDFTGKKMLRSDLNEIYKNYKEHEIKDIYPLVPLQEGMFFHYLVDKTSTSYVVQTIFYLNKEIDVEKMKCALQLLTKRYDALRTLFLHRDISCPLQVVLNNRKSEYQVVDFTDKQNNEKEALLEKVKKDDVSRGFDLEKDSLIRITMIKTDHDEYRMLFTIHHIITDGWSLTLLFCSLFQYYAMLERGESIERLLSMIEEEKNNTTEYSEYVNWIVKKNKDRALNYWSHLLEGYEEIAKIQPMEIPTVTDSQVEKVTMSLNREYVTKLKEYSNQYHVTPNSIVEMVWGYVLSAYNYTDDVVFGKVVSGRETELNDIESVVGLFINTVPVRYSVKEKSEISELIQMIQRQANDSSQYDYCSLADIQKNTVQGNNLIQTIIVFENFYVDYDNIQEGSRQGIVPEIESDREQLNYSISLIVSAEENEIQFDCLYDPNEFVGKEVERLLEHVCHVIKQVVSRSAEKIADLSMLTEYEMDQVFYGVNETKMEYPRDKVAIQLVEQKVHEVPDDIALVFRDKKLTYKELNKLANMLAWKIKQNPIFPDDCVLLLTKSSIEMMVAILATLKCGAAFVPVSPDCPQERINVIIEDCNPKAILVLDADVQWLDVNIPILNLSEDWIWEGEEYSNLEITAQPHNIAYVLYTSGSTGKPKGVMIENRSLVNYVNMNPHSIMWDAFKDGVNKIVSVTNYTFDIFITESIMALCVGYTIYLADEEEKTSTKSFASLCEKNGLEILQTTPSRVRAFLSDSATQRAFAGIKHIFLGGEKLTWDTVKAIAKVSNAKIYNVYGPTEATVWITKYCVDDGEKFYDLSIGKPVSNTQVFVLSNGKPCGIGIPGELCIAGESLARGYLNRAGLTNEKFVANPFGEGKMYKTGDIVKFRQDGNLIYIDRIDNQVKIRGHRIELGEILSVFHEIEEVKDSVVVVKKNSEDDSAICAYLVSDMELDIPSITKHIANKLPYYMIPQYIVQIPKIPVNASGKLDKNALPFELSKSSSEYVAPESEKEIILCKAVEEVLNMERVGINDNFFELGGNSLKAIRLVSNLNEKQYHVSLQNVMRKPDLKQLSSVLRLSASSKEAIEITRYFRNNIASDFAKSKQISLLQRWKMMLHTHTLKKDIKRYEELSCQALEHSEYSLNGIQRLSYQLGVRFFATQIPLCEDVDIQKLSRAWMKMKETYDVLGSSILLNETKIKIYHQAEEINMPYVDVSNLDDYHKKLFADNLFSIMQRFADDSYYMEKHLTVIPMCIKFDEERYSIFVTGSHLVCDAFSFDIIEEKLFEYYYADHDVSEKFAFEDTEQFIQNKFATVEMNEAKEKLELEKFNKTLHIFEEKLSQNSFKKGYYQIEPNELFHNLSSENRLQIAQKMFVDALHYTFGEMDIPVGMIRVARKTKRYNLFQYVGEYLDIIPVVIEAGSEVKIEEVASHKQIYMEENNLFFAGMLDDRDLFANSGADFPGAMIIYNNTGALAGTNRIKMEVDDRQSWNIFECEVDTKSMRFSIVFKENSKAELVTYLNEKLVKYLELYK